MSGQWMDVHDAAEALGISAEAVRKRVQRRKLESYRDGTTLYVCLDDDPTQSREASSELIESKDETIRVLQEQLEAERDARLRADHIIARLSESNAELSRTVRELEAADQEQTTDEPSHTAAHSDAHESPDPEDPQTASGGRESGAQRRSWWRRLFGAER